MSLRVMYYERATENKSTANNQLIFILATHMTSSYEFTGNKDKAFRIRFYSIDKQRGPGGPQLFHSQFSVVHGYNDFLEGIDFYNAVLHERI